MPVFGGDITSSKAVSPPLEKGLYTFTVGDPQVFSRFNKKNEEVYGIKFPLRVTDGPEADHLIFYDTYFHSEGGVGAAKRFAMAVMGYKVDEASERKFNNEHGKDQEAMHIDFAEKELGDFWKSLGGKNVVGDLDITTSMYEGNEQLQQKFKKWLPYGA
jgi:hypothetical protein